MMVIYIRGLTDFCLVVILKSIVSDRKRARTFSGRLFFCVHTFLVVIDHYYAYVYVGIDMTGILVLLRDLRKITKSKTNIQVSTRDK